VTPVRNDVRPKREQQTRDAGAALGRAVWYMARQAPGKPNIMTGKKPDMKAPALGSPAKKKRFRVAVAP